MAMVRRCRSMELNKVGEEKLRLGFGCVEYSRGLGRKRIVISSNLEPLLRDSFVGTPLKRQCSGKIELEAERSYLELLPQDVLVKVLCGVEHEDLKQLSQVSRTIREATLIAKKCHFEYTTPRKIRAFRTLFNSENQIDLVDIETPKAPLRTSSKKQICRKAIAEVSTVLFGTEDEWENGRGLFAE